MLEDDSQIIFSYVRKQEGRLASLRGVPSFTVYAGESITYVFTYVRT